MEPETRCPPPYPGLSTIILLGKRVQLKNIIGNMMLDTKDYFVSLSDEFEWKENKQLKIIKAPDFFDEGCLNPDQQIIDLMALSHPAPKLFILVVDAENTHEDKVLAQIRQFKNTFGEKITANLAVTVPDIESLQALRHLQDRLCIPVTMASESLAVKCTEWCSGRLSFQYDYSNYIIDAVNRRRTTLAQRGGDGNPQFNHLKAGAESSSVSTLKSASANERQNGDELKPEKTHNQSELQREPSDCSANRTADSVFNIVLLGKSGTGKSASANTILDAVINRKSNHFKCEVNSLPVTTECKTALIQLPSGLKLRVVDTPDFFHRHLKLNEEQIEECKKYCQSEPGIVLLVLQLSRVTEEEGGILEKLEGKLDSKIREKTLVLFTHGDDFKKGSSQMMQFVNERGHLKSIVDLCAYRYHVFNNKSKDVNQVRELFMKIPDYENYFPDLKKKSKDQQCSLC